MGEKISGGSRLLITMACFVIVVAGMKAAQGILVPFLLSLFIAIICVPLLNWLRKKGVPNVLAVILVLLAVIIIGISLGALIGSSLSNFSENLPKYQTNLTNKTVGIFTWLQKIGIDISSSKLTASLDPGSAMKLAGETLVGLSSVLSNAFIILLTVIFILLEAAGFPSKLRSATGNSKKTMGRMSKITESINRYLAIKTIISIIAGTSIAIWLWVMGIDYPLLWGFLAFLLNYIPNIGVIIAAIPAVLLAFIEIGLGSALLAALGYFLIYGIIGGILEPRFLGKGLGLSILIVFLSLIFWGWVLGPVGMILSVPLTMIIKIALESDEDHHWAAVLMGS